jgi:hypothetical protein
MSWRPHVGRWAASAGVAKTLDKVASLVKYAKTVISAAVAFAAVVGDAEPVRQVNGRSGGHGNGTRAGAYR